MVGRAGRLTRVMGFLEKMPPELLQLKRRGLVVIDLERDCHAFSRPLKRALGIDPENIIADEFL